jgi:predicted nucleic acid-binding protein
VITRVNAVLFRRKVGEMLNQVQYRNDSILIKKMESRWPLVDADLFARIRRMRERFDALSEDPCLRDPADQQILATLRTSGADYLIAGDKDLLALTATYPIVTPAMFQARHG